MFTFEVLRFAYSLIRASFNSERVQVPAFNRYVVAEVELTVVAVPFADVPLYIQICRVGTCVPLLFISIFAEQYTPTIVASAGMDDVSNLKYM